VTIDPDSPDHLYEQVAAHLRRQIQSGEITGRLPSLTELTEDFGVSQGVATRAVQLLVTEGLAETKPGRGTFVKRETPHQD
jgi:GntR family transcriptional regulator